MKILIVGLGSIGRRHASILQQHPEIECAAFRSKKGTLKDGKNDLMEFSTIEEALNFRPDGVIISNPTSLHVQSALPFLMKGIKVLIEKPISFSLSDAQILLPYKHLIRVAYCMRFLSVYSQIEKIFEDEPPFKISFKRSFFLPNWHPYADYRQEYVASKELGGGAVRTLSHELDLIVKWFGKPNSIQGITDKISFLEIDSDDFAFYVIKTQQGCRVAFEIDLFSPNNVFMGEAYTSAGKYFWDLNSLQFWGYADKTPQTLLNLSNNDFVHMYENQIADFIDFITSGTSKNSTFDEACLTLELIETIDHEI